MPFTANVLLPDSWTIAEAESSVKSSTVTFVVSETVYAPPRSMTAS